MKRRTAALVLALAFGMASNVSAAPSISLIIPENPQVVSGTLADGQELVVQNAQTDAYENTTVAEVVAWANDDNTVPTVKEILTSLEVDTKQEFRTEGGSPVNPTLYEQLTPFVDLAIREGDRVTYNSNGSIRTEVTIEAAKDMDKSDLMIMQIDPTTGKVYFIAVEDLDKETGKITATFPTLGPISLMKTVPIVVKNVSPERYLNRKTAEVVTKFIEEKKDIRFEDVLDAMEALQREDGTRITQINVAEDVTVNVADYDTAMGFADLAIKVGPDGYLYDMDGSLEADARRDIHDTDWERLVLAGNPGFDVEAASEDMALLEELDPFVIEGSFLMQISPVTGDAEYVYEPEIYFAYPEDDEEDETEAAGTEEPAQTELAAGTEEAAETEEAAAVEEEVRRNWKIHDEDREDTEDPDLVIRAEYRSMGPFAVFLPTDAR